MRQTSRTWGAWLIAVSFLVGPLGSAEAQLFGPKATVTSPEGKSIEEAQQEAYDGPKARIAVSRFTDKTGKGWWTGAIGDGMADMMATALFHSNRYILLERQTLGDVLKEQDLATAGRIKKGTEAPTGEIEGAELLVAGAVTEFEGAQSGVAGGIGGFGGFGRVVGGVLGGIKNAHMAIDVRVIDTKTSRILAAASVEGQATDFSLGGALAGAGGGGALGGALGGWSKTPTEKALRICIQEAVKFIVSKTPQSFYRHRPAEAAVAAAAPVAAPAAPAATNPGPAVAAAPAAAPTGAPPRPGALQSIRADHDKNIVLDLTEAKQRGATLTVTVALRSVGQKQSESFQLQASSSVLDYQSGETSSLISSSGFVSGRVNPGELKTLRAVFKAPKGAKVAITLVGLGTFDDVVIQQ